MSLSSIATPFVTRPFEVTQNKTFNVDENKMNSY